MASCRARISTSRKTAALTPTGQCLISSKFGLNTPNALLYTTNPAPYISQPSGLLPLYAMLYPSKLTLKLAIHVVSWYYGMHRFPQFNRLHGRRVAFLTSTVCVSASAFDLFLTEINTGFCLMSKLASLFLSEILSSHMCVGKRNSADP